MKKQATISWSIANEEWVLRLWDEESEEWNFSKSWSVKDVDENGIGWVSDLVLCEIANLQDLGWTVRVIV